MSGTRKVFLDSDPRLEPLVQSAERIGLDVSDDPLVRSPDGAQDLRRYRGEMWEDPDTRPIGTMTDLLDVWENINAANRRALHVSDRLRECGALSVRQNIAVVTIRGAAQLLDASLLIHTARDSWFSYGVLANCRMAVELVGKSAFIAAGSKDEAQRWLRAHTVQPKKKRRGLEIKMDECWSTLDGLVDAVMADADRPKCVYTWLCNFVHFDGKIVKRPPTKVDTYAALAYAAWITAIVSRRIVGGSPVPRYPRNMPAKVPWT